MCEFINIHTHHIQNDNTISIYNNRFLFDKEIKTKTYFSVGFHPYDINLITEHSFSDFEKKIEDKNCKAIGECGLDKRYPNFEIQKKVFEKQLFIALKYKKPVIIHCVKAFDEVIEMCNPFQHKIKIIIHGFNKSEELALQLIAKGFYISLHHSILKKENFKIDVLDLNKIFFETDTKVDITIEEIYKIASFQLKISEDVLKAKIYSNFNLLFL